ncbi:MAG TPA: hypothetical protein VK053_23180 [Jiangellaceae bacterium]|nr:hypothetical protein [Jiangellaceae bacterium]
MSIPGGGSGHSFVSFGVDDRKEHALAKESATGKNRRRLPTSWWGRAAALVLAAALIAVAVVTSL